MICIKICYENQFQPLQPSPPPRAKKSLPRNACSVVKSRWLSDWIGHRSLSAFVRNNIDSFLYQTPRTFMKILCAINLVPPVDHLACRRHLHRRHRLTYPEAIFWQLILVVSECPIKSPNERILADLNFGELPWFQPVARFTSALASTKEQARNEMIKLCKLFEAMAVQYSRRKVSTAGCCRQPAGSGSRLCEALSQPKRRMICGKSYNLTKLFFAPLSKLDVV